VHLGAIGRQRDDKAVADGAQDFRDKLGGFPTRVGLRTNKSARVFLAAVFAAEKAFWASAARPVNANNSASAEQPPQFKREVAIMPMAVPLASVSRKLMRSAALAAAMEALRLSPHDSFASMPFDELDKFCQFVGRQLVNLESLLAKRLSNIPLQ